MMRMSREKRGSAPEMRPTSTTVQQANVYRVIVRVSGENVLYNGYNRAKTGTIEWTATLATSPLPLPRPVWPPAERRYRRMCPAGESGLVWIGPDR